MTKEKKEKTAPDLERVAAQVKEYAVHFVGVTPENRKSAHTIAGWLTKRHEALAWIWGEAGLGELPGIITSSDDGKVHIAFTSAGSKGDRITIDSKGISFHGAPALTPESIFMVAMHINHDDGIFGGNVIKFDPKTKDTHFKDLMYAAAKAWDIDVKGYSPKGPGVDAMIKKFKKMRHDFEDASTRLAAGQPTRPLGKSKPPSPGDGAAKYDLTT